MRDRRSDEKILNIAGIICFAVSLIAILSVCRFISGDDIWYDETFSMGFIRGGFADIISLTAKDVHPPFYYMYLKAFTYVYTALLGDGALIQGAKAASIIPWLGLFVLALTYIRKRYGVFVAGFFMMLVSLMPQLDTYYTEIRMYSLALLLITAEILTAIRICNKDGKCGIGTWIIFTLLGILTAYTQYYACIAIAGIYAALLFIMIKNRTTEKKALIYLSVCALISAVIYLPWIPVLKTQMGNISGNYWIQPLSLRSIPGCIKFILLPVTDIRHLPYIAVILTVITLAAAFVVFVLNCKTVGKDNDATEDIVDLIICISPLVIVVVSGFILSIAGTPIFIYRYMIPALGGLWLGVAIMINRAFSGRIAIVMLCPFFLTGALSMAGFNAEEGKKVIQMYHAAEAMTLIPSGSSVITNFDHVSAVIGFYRPDVSVYLYDAEIDRLIPEMYDNVSDSLDDEAVCRLVNSEPDVFFLGSFNIREDIVADWNKKGVDAELIDSCLIERYWINIYVLNG
ncbi:MAG: hypothetical protein IK123_02230 [Lachnospiraceae bacterium]|nr:hypothetical protein [Lachnospiraceae bacterium]